MKCNENLKWNQENIPIDNLYTVYKSKIEILQ